MAAMPQHIAESLRLSGPTPIFSEAMPPGFREAEAKPPEFMERLTVSRRLTAMCCGEAASRYPSSRAYLIEPYAEQGTKRTINSAHFVDYFAGLTETQHFSAA
jgi:hypothetical protein